MSCVGSRPLQYPLLPVGRAEGAWRELSWGWALMSSASAVPLDNTPSSFSRWGRVLLNYLGCLSLPRSWGSRHILPCPACPACASVNLLAFFLKVGSVAILCPLPLCMYFRNILSISTKKNAWILLGCDKSMYWFIKNHNLHTTGYFNPRTWLMTAFVQVFFGFAQEYFCSYKCEGLIHVLLDLLSGIFFTWVNISFCHCIHI